MEVIQLVMLRAKSTDIFVMVASMDIFSSGSNL